MWSGIAAVYPQSTIAPHSDFARAILHVYAETFWWAVAVFGLVSGWFLYAIIRYRARPGRAPRPGRRGHTGAEVAWTLAPVAILVSISVPTIRTILDADYRAAPDSAVRVEIIGHRWWWEYKYPDLGIVTANELHLPVHQVVDLAITSADVIHSFWVPELAGKRDAIPGHTNHIVFSADSAGEYPGQCAEFCGASHANMGLRVFVDPDSTFEAWARQQRTAPVRADSQTLAARGRAVFSHNACIGCHFIQGVSQGLVGPNLTHVGSRATIAGAMLSNDSVHLAQWIADAPRVKPGSQMPRMQPPLSDSDVAALVAYLKSLQ